MATHQAWWETRAFAWTAILLSMVPLLWPAVPPLNDLPDHLGRYYIAAHLAGSPDLQRHWAFEHGVVGNLGVDLLVGLLSAVLPIVLATKLVVLLIPPLWVGGLIRLSRQGDGRIGPAAAFAFPLAYAWPLQFGFVNFMLASALALHALWLWVRLAEHPTIRGVLFVPIAFALWIAHSFGWGLFGLLAFTAESVRRRRAGASWLETVVRASRACAPLAPPALLMHGAASATGVTWNWEAKIIWLVSLLRERWQWYDIACAIVLLLVLYATWRDRRRRFDPVTGAAGLIGFVAFLVLPRLLAGGAYVDMRMLAPALALALVAIRSSGTGAEDRRRDALLATGAATFFAVRTIGTTVAMLLYAGTQSRALEAVAHLPRGAAVLVLVKEPCLAEWRSDRLGHVAGLAIVDRDVFHNGQWALPGQQLLRPLHPAAEPYRTDPSQSIFPADCSQGTDFATAIRRFDRGTYDYVWTMSFPAHAYLATDVRLIWSNRVSALYRVLRKPPVPL